MPTSWASVLTVGAIALAIAGASLVFVGVLVAVAFLIEVAIDVRTGAKS